MVYTKYLLENLLRF